MTRPRRGRGADRGQSTVELALVLPVVVLLLLVLLQVGLVARDVVLVAHAAREGARAAATDRSPSAARRAVEASSGLDQDRLTVRTSGGRTPGSRVRVEVTYRVPTTVPIVGRWLGDRTVRTSVTMRVEAPKTPRNGHSGHPGCKGYYTLGLPFGGCSMATSGHSGAQRTPTAPTSPPPPTLGEPIPWRNST